MDRAVYGRDELILMDYPRGPRGMIVHRRE